MEDSNQGSAEWTIDPFRAVGIFNGCGSRIGLTKGPDNSLLMHYYQ